jgi:hypothetical protein
VPKSKRSDPEPDPEITEDTAEDALADVELPLETADSAAEGEPMAHPGHDQADDDFVAAPEES